MVTEGHPVHKKDVTDLIRERILNLYYQPGDPLNEAKLAQELRVSRTPIREAFIRLSAENLVTTIPNSGARVSDINLRDFEGLIEFRIILERGAARLAAMKASEQAIRRLEELQAKVQKTGSKDTSILMDCDTEFHKIIREVANNRYLDESLSVVMNQFIRIQKLILHKPHTFRSDLPKVIQAFKGRDADQMEKVIVDHVNRFLGEVRRCFRIV
jgi:DNA-binding GntR family transcriptional regulator